MQAQKLEAMGTVSSKVLTDAGIFLWVKCRSYLAFSEDWLIRGLLPYLAQGS